MKKFFFFIAFIAMSMLSIAQNNQLVWLNGRLLYGTPIESIDSLTYDEMQDVDTLHLLLPHTLLKVEYDTIVNNVYIYDTIVETETQIVFDTVYITEPCPDSPTAPEDSTSKVENGHEYVDLGLSVKWATCNVGATKPEEYGDYFAWGETVTKSSYPWGNYKYSKGSSKTLTKYCTNSSYGTIDNKTQLDLSDDAARANWGGNWRMPTDVEITELCTECTWTWITQNGVNGYKVTGSNGNSIFLPAAGYYNGSQLYDKGSEGRYWSGSLHTDSPSMAYSCKLYLSAWRKTVDYRHGGLPVRAVCK